MEQKQFRQWAIHRQVSDPEALPYELQGMGEIGTHMMIGGEEHIVLGIAQVIPVQSGGDTTDVVVLLNVQPLHPQG